MIEVTIQFEGNDLFSSNHLPLVEQFFKIAINDLISSYHEDIQEGIIRSRATGKTNLNNSLIEMYQKKIEVLKQMQTSITVKTI